VHSKRIQVILGTINTLPIGLNDEEIEKYYHLAYRPTLRCLYHYPKLNFTMHYSGVLLDWIDANHSEFIAALGEMTQGRHTEILVGAQFDPIMPLIPKPDRLGQIELMTTNLRKLFGRRYRGAWVSQQIWDPEIASSYNAAGVEYAFLDDYHFARAGFEARDMLCPCITEDLNKPLTVFPVSNHFRQRFWLTEPADLIKEILDLASDQPDQVLTILIDGEAGAWAADGEEAGRTAWLTEFLDLVQEKQQQGLIDTVLPSKYLRKPAERSRGYFPPTVWDEMQIWSKGPEARFNYAANLGNLTPGINRLGYFFGKEVRQSMAHYQECNHLYCKMQYVHSLVNQIRGDKYRKQVAREELWRGQHHAPYWHGGIGGIYHNRLRKAAYSSLLRAEKHTREKGIFAPSLSVLDYDLDGLQEIMFQGNEINAYLHLRGGILFELDYMLQPFNYLDTMSRYPEVYHMPEHEAEGYDSYHRRGFVDHVLAVGATIDDFNRAAFEDLADLYQHHYQIDDLKRESNVVRLSGQSMLGPGGSLGRIGIKKQYSFIKSQIQVAYTICNTGTTAIDAVFSPELNLGFQSCDVKDLRVYRKESRTKAEEMGPGLRELPQSQEIYFEDLLNRAAIHCQASPACEWWSVPVYTIHAEDVWWVSSYQSNCLLPRWPLKLEPAQCVEFSFTLSIAKLKAPVA
jgi:alpha-amylase